MPNSQNSPNYQSQADMDGMKEKMIGPENIGKIVICGSEVNGLIDSGSQITLVSESFYRSSVFESVTRIR